jgi:hypothetical protein
MLRDESGCLLAEFNITISDYDVSVGANGWVIMAALSAETTSALHGDFGLYDIKVKAGAGTVYRIAQGSATISLEQTRPDPIPSP